MASSTLLMTDADQQWLHSHFAKIVSRASLLFDVPAAHIRNPRKHKTGAVVAAREYVICALMGSVQYSDNRPNRKLRIEAGRASTPADGWLRISTPMIADLLRCDHSAIVLTLKRIRGRYWNLRENVYSMA